MSNSRDELLAQRDEAEQELAKAQMELDEINRELGIPAVPADPGAEPIFQLTAFEDGSYVFEWWPSLDKARSTLLRAVEDIQNNEGVAEVEHGR